MLVEAIAGGLFLILAFFLAFWLVLDCPMPNFMCHYLRVTSAKLEKRCLHFDYGPVAGPHTWPQLYAAASCGRAQSPINIDTKAAIWQAIRPLKWQHYEQLPTSYRLHNTGTGNLELWPAQGAFPCGRLPTVAASDSDECGGGGGGSSSCGGGNMSCGASGSRGGGGGGGGGGGRCGQCCCCCPPPPPPPPACSYSFRFVSIHWPSEHTVDNRTFALELQAIHVLNQPPPACQPDNTSTMLAVAYLFRLETGSPDNPYLKPLVDRLCDVRSTGSSTCVEGFPLAWLCPPPGGRRGFYEYAGSWTVPPCTESVTWLICAETAGAISPGQLAELQQLRSACGERVQSNARPVQKLNCRTVRWNTFD